MKILDWLNWKFKGELPAFTSQDFYLMQSYYDTRSANIAVIGNSSKYKWLITHLKKQMRERNNLDDRMIKINDGKYIFIRDGLESTYVLIEDIHKDLEKHRIKYRKYM